MNGYLNKYKIIQILFAVAVVMLIANLLVGRFNSEIDSEPKLEFDKEISPNKVDSLFLASLKNYNINQNWIHRSSTKRNKKTSALYIYKVDVPNDLPNVLLIREIYKNLSATKLQISSKEVKVGGTSLLEISNANKLVLSAVFIYKKDISHLAGYLNLLVFTPQDFGIENKNELLNSTNNITLLFSPSTKNIDLANDISKNNKAFGLIIDNNIDELKYEINNTFDKSRINQGVNAVLKAFPKTKFVLFPDNFNPNLKIRSAFRKMGTKTLFEKKLINFTKEYKTGLRKLFKSYVMNTGVSDTLKVIISTDNFFIVKKDLKKYEKLGYRFVTY